MGISIIHFIDLFEDKIEGILPQLEDEGKKRSPCSNTFFQNVKANCSKNPAFFIPKVATGEMNFVIRHFAKDVSYSAVSYNNTILL